jgi:hypothetical protein
VFPTRRKHLHSQELNETHKIIKPNFFLIPELLAWTWTRDITGHIILHKLCNLFSGYRHWRRKSATSQASQNINIRIKQNTETKNSHCWHNNNCGDLNGEQRNYEFHKMLEISWVAAQLAASQEGLGSMGECLLGTISKELRKVRHWLPLPCANQGKVR